MTTRSQNIHVTRSVSEGKSASRAFLACASVYLVVLGPLVAAAQNVPVSTPGVPAERQQAADDVADEVARLVEQLGSEQFIERRRAEQALARLALTAFEPVFDALKQAESHEDIEIASRAKYLVQQLPVEWVREGDPAEVREALRSYGDLSEVQRMQRAQQLAAAGGDAGLIGLCRIVRFEREPSVSKRVAIYLLETKQDDPEFWRRNAAVVQRTLGPSQRAASDWLRTELLTVEQPKLAVERWNAAIAKERELTPADPRPGEAVAVQSLMQRQVALLEQLDRQDEARAMIGQLVELADGTPTSLARLVGWLTKKKAWEAVDTLHQRFAEQFKDNPLLLYTLAEARLAEGETAAAEKWAKQALEAGGGDAQVHHMLARQLERRGMFRWAEKEFRYAMELRPPGDLVGFYSTRLLAEMLHDQEKEQQAAKVLEEFLAKVDADPKIKVALSEFEQDPDMVRARMHFFRARQFQTQDNREQQFAELKKAIDFDPTDADVLIDMYHATDAGDPLRKETVQRIEKAVEQFQEMIDNDPDDSSGYNQYAWMVANTEGDFDKATQYSRESVKLARQEVAENEASSSLVAGHLDTLAHCYFAQGDFAQAVKTQQEAVALEPHSGQIGRAYERFKRALAESKGEEKQ